MKKYVYEVVSTNIHNGAKDSSYFNSRKAAEKWKELKEKDMFFVAEIFQWRVFLSKDI